MEHTGLYTRQIVHYLLAREVRGWIESALQSIKVTIQELLAVDPVSGKTLEQVNSKAIKGLEKKMQEFIAKDDNLKKKYDLLTSVKDVGKTGVSKFANK